MSDGGDADRPSRSSYQRSAPALIGALITVLALIAAVWALSRFQHRGVSDPAQPIDYSAELAAVRESAPFAVLAPSSTPAGWHATSVAWDGEPPDLAWHLGYLTDAGEYVGLEEGNGDSPAFVAASTQAAVAGRPVLINGHPWRTLSSTDGHEHALVRRIQGVTTVVTGTAPVADLETFAQSLES